MKSWLIILFALWIFPILSYILLRISKHKPLLRKKIFLTSFILSCVTVFCLFVNISTTSIVLDWCLVAGVYLSASLGLGWTQFQNNRFLKIIGLILSFCIYGIGYLSATVGIFGVGFIVADYDVDKEQKLGNGLTFKEYNLGNAISDYRGMRIEISKTIPWLPLIEWQNLEKEYFSDFPYSKNLTVDYKPDQKKIYLSADESWGKDSTVKWADTLLLK